jgi:hypothetical protein
MTDFNLSDELKKYLDSVSGALEAGGMEPLVREGILRDLSAQIAEMRSEESLSDEEILSRLDPPDAYLGAGTTKAAPPAPAPEDKPARVGSLWGRVLDALAIIAAVLAVGIESLFKICANYTVNPMPTALHFLILASVPFIIAWTSMSLRPNSPRFRARTLAFGNGFLFIVGLFYSVAFLPLVRELAVSLFKSSILIWIISPILFPVLFVVLVGAAPFLTFAAACSQRMRLNERNEQDVTSRSIFRPWFLGAALALIIIGGWESRLLIVDNAMNRATRGEGEARQSAINTLKFVRAENIVRERSYGRSARQDSVFFFFREDYIKIAPAEYQALYFRVTGHDYRDDGRALSDESWRERDLRDAEIGGDNVGISVRDLELASAVLDISYYFVRGNARIAVRRQIF